MTTSAVQMSLRCSSTARLAVAVSISGRTTPSTNSRRSRRQGAITNAVRAHWSLRLTADAIQIEIGETGKERETPMKIVKVSALPMSAPVPEEKRHRTDLGTKVKSDATLIRVETDNGPTGIGAALGTPPIIAAIVEHELAAECVGEDPMFSERIYEKMYNGSRSRPALDRGVTQADESRRRGVIMEAIAGVDIAVWDVKAQALGIPLYQALGASRSSVRGYASGGCASGDEAEAELAGYAAKGFTAAKMRVVGRGGFSISNGGRRVKAARRGLGSNVELMIDAHGSLEVATAIKLSKELEPYDIAWFEEPVSPDDHAGQAEVRRSTTIPIASGEREFT